MCLKALNTSTSCCLSYIYDIFPAPQAPSKPLKIRLKVITMKETSIWIALSRYGCSDMSKRLEVLQHKRADSA